MTTPDGGAPAPGPDRPFAAPGTGSGWGDAPGAPAPSGYEAQLPSPPAPASPYGAPAAGHGDAAATDHGSAPGYGTDPGWGTAPGYGTAPEWGTAPGWGAQPPAYGAAQPGYGAVPPAYGAPYAPAAQPATVYAPYGAWAPPSAPATDGLAIASLVLSCSSFLVYLTAPVGLGLGIAALRRIRRTGAQGRGLAIAGIVVGGVVTALMLAFLAIMFAVVAASTPSSAWMTTANAGAVLAPVVQGLTGAAPR